MKREKFIIKLKEIAEKYKTVYMWGTFGSPVTEKIISEKARQYPKWYTDARVAHLRNLVGKDYFAFDCVGLIKGVLWGWSGDRTKYHGGATYNSNEVPDISADFLVTKLNEVSTDFWDIKPGEVVWMPGHVGIYVGNRKVVECTPAWKNGVQITTCLNIPGENDPVGRWWNKHGELPYLS